MADRVIRLIEKIKPEFVAFDIETNAVTEHDCKVIGIAFAFDTTEGFYLMLSKYEKQLGKLVNFYSPAMEDKLVRDLCRALSPSKLIMHNGIFDIACLYHNYSIDLTHSLFADTLLMKHTIDEEPPFGLKDLGEIAFGEEAKDEQKDLADSVIKAGGKWNKAYKDIYMGDSELIAKYAIKDVILTAKLFELLDDELISQGLENFFYNQEVMPLYKKATIPMKLNGVNIDVDYFKKLKKEVEDGIIGLTDKVFEIIAPKIGPKIKEILDKAIPTSRIGQFAEELLELHNIPIPVNKRTGKPTLAKTALKQLEVQYPAEKVLKWLLWEPKLVEKEIAIPLLDAEGNESYDENGELKTQIVKKLVADPNSECPYPLSDEVIYSIKKKIYVSRNPHLPRVFNLSSSQHLGWLIFEAYGVEAVKFSRKTGAAQVDKAALETLDLPFIPTLLELKKEEKLLSTYIDPILNIHKNGKIYPSLQQFGTTSGRYSCGGGLNLQTLPRDDKRIKKGFIAPKGYKIVNADFCLHPKTELLTKRGWIPVLDINQDDLVWQVDKESLKGTWVVPKRIVKREYNGPMYRYGNRRGQFDVTENHTMLFVGQRHKYRKDKEKLRYVQLSQEGIQDTTKNLLLASSTSDTLKTNYSKEDLWKICAIQADGSIQYKTRKDCYRIQVSIPGNREKLRELFGPGQVANSIRKGHTLPTETWNTIYYSHPLLDGKDLNIELLGDNQVDEFVEALSFFDGSIDKHGAITWGTTNKALADRVQAYLVRNGYEARHNVLEVKNANHNTFYSLRISKKARVRLRSCDVFQYDYSGMVGCVTVESGFILIRSEGQTFVTGNCSLEPRIFSWVSNDDGLKKVYHNGLDLYSQVAIDTFGLDGVSANEADENYLKKVHPEIRNQIKAIALAIPYGSSPARIAEMLKIDYKEAKEIIDNYLGTYPELKEYMRRQEQDVIRNGIVYTDFGRIRHLYEAKDLYEQYGTMLYNKKRMILELGDKEGTEVYYRFRTLLNNAKNFPIQATAAHVCNAAMIKLSDSIKKARVDAKLVLTIHDEITCIAAEKDAQKTLELLKDAMQNNEITNKIDIPILADPVIADNFAEAK